LDTVMTHVASWMTVNNLRNKKKIVFDMKH
jgi:hypothetical protein